MMSDEPDDFDADYDEGLAGIEDEELNEEEQLTDINLTNLVEEQLSDNDDDVPPLPPRLTRQSSM